MNTELLQRYSEIKRKLSELKDEEDLLKVAILDDMNTNGKKKVETIFGKFSVLIHKSYIYPEAVQLAMLRAKDQGKCKVKQTPYVKFTANK